MRFIKWKKNKIGVYYEVLKSYQKKQKKKTKNNTK
jgi:hypothetical protein